MGRRMSRYELTRWSGLAGLTSGLLIVAGAVSFPFVEPVVSGTLFVSGHILLFFLLTGVYSTHSAHAGLIGFFGYVLSTIGNALFIALQTASSFVLSRVEVTGDFFPAAVPITNILFSIGLLLFAISNTRVRALPSWPGWLMFIGMASNPILVRLPAELPEPVRLIPPILVGLGVIGFGWVLRRN